MTILNFRFLRIFQVIMYLGAVLTQYTEARKESHVVATEKGLKYNYFCGNLSNYLFSSTMNFTSFSEKGLQTLRQFENSLTEELFLRRNKQMATKIIEEIKSERQRRNRRIFFMIGAGKVHQYFCPSFTMSTYFLALILYIMWDFL